MALGLENLASQQPLATRFLTEALSHQQLMHAYVLSGKDIATSYMLALSVAAVINCTARPSPATACGECRSCRWIAENAHPGVMTVSNMTYLEDVDPETGHSRTKTGRPQQGITVGQVQMLLKSLALHSGEFCRVVIFCGAEEHPADAEAPPALIPPVDWTPQDNGQFVPQPLDRKLFADQTANKFLKTLEEPPANTVFFLLTDSADKLLDTIVSRCQLIPCQPPPDAGRIPLTEADVAALAQVAAWLQPPDFYPGLQAFQAYLTDQSLDAKAGLIKLEAYLWRQFLTAPDNGEAFQTTKNALRQLERTRKMIDGKVRPEAALEQCFLTLCS